jgi:hypothetical protein
MVSVTIARPRSQVPRENRRQARLFLDRIALQSEETRARLDAAFNVMAVHADRRGKPPRQEVLVEVRRRFEALRQVPGVLEIGSRLTKGALLLKVARVMPAGYIDSKWEPPEGCAVPEDRPAVVVGIDELRCGRDGIFLDTTAVIVIGEHGLGRWYQRGDWGNDATDTLLATMRRMFLIAPAIFKDAEVRKTGQFVVETDPVTRWAGRISPIRPISTEHRSGDPAKQLAAVYFGTCLDRDMGISTSGKLFIAEEAKR